MKREEIRIEREVTRYQGFHNANEIVRRLKLIQENKSDIRVYGQVKAKKQMFKILSGVIARIDNIKRHRSNIKEVRGNIIYIIGAPGTGKTKLCYAIASAFCKYPEKTCVFCHSENVTSETELGI
ncbi:MAG: hypothetical protein LBJ32_04715 [Oscillospiraceae bacterium]|jgi:DNA replication protein DnaC|nr:hypothetical protein [Oscillospiraceae bacterium]